MTDTEIVTINGLDVIVIRSKIKELSEKAFKDAIEGILNS